MRRLFSLVLASTLSFGCLASYASADEGMWTFDNFPAAKVKRAYGFSHDAGAARSLAKIRAADPGAARPRSSRPRVW